MTSFHDLDVRFVPIERWPGAGTPAHRRKPSPFRARWRTTLHQLRRELDALSARNVLVQTHHTSGQLRRDGLPRADARDPDDPGVILSMETKHGPLSFPCDTYTSWQDNVRAIVLAMESLRRVDRYGVTRTGEQYRGWKQLPGSGGTTDAMDARAAARPCEPATDPPRHCIAHDGRWVCTTP